MAISRGKEFEKLFESAVLEFKNEGGQVDIQRLFDVVNKKTIKQPSDYICYYKPNQIYVECKSTHNSYFNFFEQPQYERLLEKIKVDGIKGGMLVWYVNAKRVFWFDISWLYSYNCISGKKSISLGYIDNRYVGNYGIFEIDQTTARVKPKMKLESMFKYIIGGESNG